MIERKEEIWEKVPPEIEFKPGKVPYSLKHFPYKQRWDYVNRDTKSRIRVYELEKEEFFIIDINGIPKSAADEINDNIKRFKKMKKTKLRTTLNTNPPNPYYAICLSNNKKFLDEFINVIDKHLPLANIKNNLIKIIGILEPIEIKDINSSNLDQAIDLVVKSQSIESFDPIWELANHLLHQNEEFISSEKVFELFEKIESNNPHFKNAQLELANILVSQPLSDNEKENIARLEQALFHALHSAEKAQSLTDQLFHKLCGYKDLTPIIKNVKGDWETLINIAEQTRLLIQQNMALQTQSRIKSEEINQSINQDQKTERTKISDRDREKGKEKEKEKEKPDIISQQQTSFGSMLQSFGSKLWGGIKTTTPQTTAEKTKENTEIKDKDKKATKK